MTTMLIPGSERFTSRPVDEAELRRRIDSALELHTIDTAEGDELDPLTYEVVRHHLWAITEEMGETLKRMSGSHAVTESNDFNFILADEIGNAVQVGLYNVGLVGPVDLAIQWTLMNRSRNPGIRPGDMFVCNDPWVGGGLHQNDAVVLAPVFHGSQLYGWVASICHQLDLGGIAPGSFNSGADDVFSEALPTPPLKIVSEGTLLDDVADAWTRRSRLPMLVSLDLRAKIGANKVAAERLASLIIKYGPTTVKAVMKRMMDDAEARLRQKLLTINDGTWRAVTYQEQARAGDRGAHRIRLTVTKTGDHLTFDFTGTAPQTGMINCPFAGLRAGILFTLLPILAGDIPWAAGGILRCITIISEEGTIVNARFPAAIGKAPFGPAWAVSNLVSECFGRMLDTAPQTRRDVQSVCSGTFDACMLAGTDERAGIPLPFVTAAFDAMAAGFGAQVDHDGVDTGGFLMIPQGRAPDVEMTEYLYPVLYLWRREEPDSGGAGRRRGGVSGSVCIIPHGTSAPMMIGFAGGGKAISQNIGLAGGYPGSSQLDLIARGSAATKALSSGRIPADLSELGGRVDIMPVHGESVLNPGDALYISWQGGGGYGDPLHRDPQDVASDVAEHKVSRCAAEHIYGVVLSSDGDVDIARTAARRDELCRNRLSQPPSRSSNFVADDVVRLDDNLVVLSVDGERVVACAHCGREHGPLGSDIPSTLVRTEGTSRLGGPRIFEDPAAYIDNEVRFVQLCCPGCATAVDTRVALAADLRDRGQIAAT